MSEKTRARFDRYDPDVLEMMDELGQLRRRADRAGRTMAEQSAYELDREAQLQEPQRPRQISPAPVRRPLHGGATGHYVGDELDPAKYDR